MTRFAPLIPLTALALASAVGMASANTLDMDSQILACLDPEATFEDRAAAVWTAPLTSLDDRPAAWRFANLEQAQITLNGFTGYSEASTRVAYVQGTEPDKLARAWPTFATETSIAFADLTGDVFVIVWESEKTTGCHLVIQDGATPPTIDAPIKRTRNAGPIGTHTIFDLAEMSADLIEPTDAFAAWRPARPDTHAYLTFSRPKPVLLN